MTQPMPVGGTRQLVAHVQRRCREVHVHLNERAVETVFEGLAAELRLTARSPELSSEKQWALDVVAEMLEEAAR